MDSRPEEWYSIGINNDAFEETEKNDKGEKTSQFPILHIPCDQVGHENLQHFSLPGRNTHKQHGDTQFSDPIINGRSISQARLKKNKLRRLWKLKFVRSKSSNHRVTTVTVLLILAVLLCFAVLAVVLYLTVGGGLEESTGLTSMPSYSTHQPVEILASRVVLGIFKLKHIKFEEDLKNTSSRKFFYLAKDVSLSLDRLFKSSILSYNYNGTEINSFRNGSVIVDCRIYLNRPYVNVAAKVGTTFLNGLVNSHGRMLLDSRFDIDVQSIMFTATRAPSRKKNNDSYPQAGWSQWTPWSSCNNGFDFGMHPACDPKMRQDRVRVCRQDAGHGDLMKDDELCEEQGGFPMEERLCDCSMPNASLTRRKCIDCFIGEICISMHNEIMATCKQPIDSNDPTGCGGHCVGPNKLCRSLGAGAYQCLEDSRCQADQFQCQNHSLCVDKAKLCDGVSNCNDGSDEFDCPSRKECPGGQFTCQSGMCIADSHFCDHYADCDDRSDEPEDCDISCDTIQSQVQCANGRCIPESVVCDATDDCGDNSDELDCNTNRTTTSQRANTQTNRVTTETIRTNGTIL